ncbi:MAG: CHAT domain-containing protein [Patiriisocius sp.]|uniref:CHAT domain-containing protein n=1 Tax=Patiriisocius sp. TaxID=2822396 RepID=UPI003EF253F3
MKKHFFIIFLFLFPLISISQENVEKEVKNSFFEYHFEGKEFSKKKFDSLFPKVISEKNKSSVASGELYLMASLMGDYKQNTHRLDSFSKIKNVNVFKNFDIEYSNFEALYRMMENEDSFKSFFTETRKRDVEKMSKNWQAIYYTLVINELNYKKQYKEAKEWSDVLLMLLENTNYEPVQAYRFRAGANYQMGKRELAMGDFERCYQLAKDEPENDATLLTSLTWNLGVFYYSNKIYEKSIPFLVASANYYEKANGNTPYLVSRYALLSVAYLANWDIKRAENNALKAKNLAENIIKTDDPYLNGLVASSLCRIYTAQGKFDEGRKVIQPAIQNTIAAYGNASSLSAAFTTDYAELEAAAGNYETAENAFQSALEMAYATDRTYSKTAALSTIINFYLTQNNYEKALKYIDDEYQILVENNDTLSSIFIANRIKNVRALLKGNKLELADTELQNLEKLSALVSFETEEHIYFKNAQFIWQQAMFEKTKDAQYLNDALKESDEFIKLLIQNKAVLGSQNSKLFYGEFVSEIIEPIVAIHVALQGISPTPELETSLLRYFEINKSSMLLNGLKDNELVKKYDISSEILSKKSFVTDTLNKLQKALNDLENQEDLKSFELVDSQVKFQDMQDSIQQVLKIDYPAYYNASTLQLSNNISYYQEKVMTKNEFIIEFYYAKNTLYRMTLTKDKMRVEVVDTPFDFDRKLLQFYDALKSNGDYVKNSKIISETLLPQIPNGTKRITIIADGILNKIPFEVLMYDNEFVIENYAVRYAGSLQLLDEQIKLSNENNNGVWGGYAPKYTNNKLMSNTSEVENIHKIMNGSIVVGDAASKENFISTATDFGLLHLAAHGTLDEVNPMLNSLLFSNNATTNEESSLTTQEIYALNINAQLAVLSACNTGNGKYEKGDGVMSMSRAFTYAGVSSTIMSLWAVPDKETAILLESFYKNLKEGKDKDVALQNAKLSYLNATDDVALKHPYYWAGFFISGDVSPTNSGFSYGWLLLGAGILFILLFIVFKMKK